jgi:hypothetical protein
MTDYDVFDTIDAQALELIGKVFDRADLQAPAVVMTALVSMLGSLLALKAIEDGLEAEELDSEAKALIGDIRHKSTAMHRLLTRKLKEREQSKEKDTGKTVH